MVHKGDLVRLPYPCPRHWRNESAIEKYTKAYQDQTIHKVIDTYYDDESSRYYEGGLSLVEIDGRYLPIPIDLLEVVFTI